MATETVRSLSWRFTDSYIRKEEMQDTVWAQKKGEAFFVCVAHWLVQELWLEQTADDGLISCWFFSHQTAPMCVKEMEKHILFNEAKLSQANFLVASFWKIIHFNLFNIMWCYSGALSNTLLNLYEEGKKTWIQCDMLF